MADHTTRFNSWLQIISNIAIILGLGLVIYELNQSKQIAHAQMVDDQIARLADRRIALMSDDPREAMAKAALRPADLNERDAVTLNALYSDVTAGWYVMRRTAELSGVFRPWKQLVKADVGRYFSSKPGRDWLKAWATEDAVWEDTELREAAMQALSEDPENFYGSKYRILLSSHRSFKSKTDG